MIAGRSRWLVSPATLACVMTILVLALANRADAQDALFIQPAAGEPLRGLTESELQRFEQGRLAYQRSFTKEEGLGPIFNLTSCSSCHFSPVGGAGVTTVNLFGFLDEGTGEFDPLIDQGGPVRQANAIDPDCIEEVPSMRTCRRKG